MLFNTFAIKQDYKIISIQKSNGTSKNYFDREQKKVTWEKIRLCGSGCAVIPKPFLCFFISNWRYLDQFYSKLFFHIGLILIIKYNNLFTKTEVCYKKISGTFRIKPAPYELWWCWAEFLDGSVNITDSFQKLICKKYSKCPPWNNT